MNRKKNDKGWICKHCGILKEAKLFHKHGKYPDGTKKRHSWCNECMKEANYKSRLKCGKQLLTKEEYNVLFAQQGGKCAICGIHQKELKTKLHADHDHKTKEIRGLLCFKCNAALGMMNDNTEILQRAIQYIKRARIKIYSA